ncbi:hypothetical protein KM043_016916 [Ampulex compressa]|nr:hypothetical protein KM043_016916 [Ampulex compressa]
MEMQRRLGKIAKEEREKGDKNVKVWKVGNKEVWKYIEKYDIVELTETWMDEKAWNRMRGRLASTYEWSSVQAVKEKRKGRAKGGLVAAVSRELGAVKVRATPRPQRRSPVERLRPERVNARTANEGGPIGGGEWKEEAKRRFKDRMINKNGRALLTGIKERG